MVAMVWVGMGGAAHLIVMVGRCSVLCWLFVVGRWSKNTSKAHNNLSLIFKQSGLHGFAVLGKSIRTDCHRQNQPFEIIVSFFF